MPNPRGQRPGSVPDEDQLPRREDRGPDLGGRRQDPELEMKAWMDKLAEIERMRSGYQEQAAKDLMTLDELAARLKELEVTRKIADQELVILKEIGRAHV